MDHNHDMGGMDMGAGSMSMGNGIPSLFTFPHMYYAVVSAAVGVATLVNIANYVIYRQRLSAAKAAQPTPAKPKSVLSRTYATITAITREASNASLIPLSFRDRTIRTPTIGRTSLIVANIIVLIVLCFYKLDTNDRWQFEDIGYRTGFVSIAQLPLIFLLAGKNNIIGWLAGMSHERLNWLHRWTARCLLLTTTIHMGYWFVDWAPYDYIGIKIRTDPITKHGVIAWAVLLWITVSSMTPIRGWSYEFFVLQHLGSFAVLIYFIYLHIPAEVYVYIWIPIGFFVFDRLVRTLYVVYTNLAIFHPEQHRKGQMSGLWACKAVFTPLLHNTTRITIQNPPVRWRAGQHVYLSCHSVVPLQSHPFTIASIPEDGKMEFLVKAEKGGTRKFFRHAEKNHGLPTAADDVVAGELKSVAIDGPYGCIRPLRQFDSVVFFAGSSGATFTVPLMRDVVSAWKQSSEASEKNNRLLATPAGAVTRHIRFIWVIKSRGQLSWFSSQLSAVMEDVRMLQSKGLDIEVDMSIYCTCDESFTEEHQFMLSGLKLSSAPQAHGSVEEKGDASEISLDEKPAANKADKLEVREFPSSDSSSLTSGPNPSGTCGPNGACCCKATIEDEDAIEAAECCCNCEPPISPERRKSQSSDSSSSPPPKLLLHPAISLFSGRPKPETIIRKTLEQARGESAVVVCGPTGLCDDVRFSTVALSDERAVHKGTGAQGVFLHCERFSL